MKKVGDKFLVEGHGNLFWVEDGSPDASASPLEVVGAASLCSVRRTLEKHLSRGTFIRLRLVGLPSAKMAPLITFSPEVLLHYFAGEVIFQAATYLGRDEPRPSEAALTQLISPLLKSYSADGEVFVDDDFDDWGGYRISVDLRVKLRGRTVQDGYELGSRVVSLIDASHCGTGLTPVTVVDLFTSGKVSVLLGLAENEWLEFKRDPYPRTENGKLELAKDVAALANAQGGVLVLGIATNRSGDADVACKIVSYPAGSVNPQSYRATLRKRVYPHLERVEILRLADIGGGELTCIVVPPQPNELKPFLVHGKSAGDGVNDNYISVVTRRGDETVATTPAAVHALMVMGRASMSRDGSET